MIMKKMMESKIEWDVLDRCWADRYEEDYGHFLDQPQIIHDTDREGSSAPEVCTDDIV